MQPPSTRDLSTRSFENKSSILSKSSGHQSRKSTKSSNSTYRDFVPPSSISVPGTILSISVEEPKDDFSSRNPNQPRSSNAADKKEGALTSSNDSHGGTENLIRNIDALIDDASSVMRGVDAQFAAVGGNGDEKKVERSLEKCPLVSGKGSSTPAAGWPHYKI
jgi:hypothetical protein